VQQTLRVDRLLDLTCAQFARVDGDVGSEGALSVLRAQERKAPEAARRCGVIRVPVIVRPNFVATCAVRAVRRFVEHQQPQSSASKPQTMHAVPITSTTSAKAMSRHGGFGANVVRVADMRRLPATYIRPLIA
jgi:hypothetical protein